MWAQLPIHSRYLFTLQTHNPIYQPATSTFRNPMYTGASQKPEQL